MKTNVLEVHEMDGVEVEGKEAWSQTNEKEHEAHRQKTDSRLQSKYVNKDALRDDQLEEDSNSPCVIESSMQGEANHAAVKEKREEHTSRIRLIVRMSMKNIDKRKTILAMLVPNQATYTAIHRLYRPKIVAILITLLWFTCNTNAIAVGYGVKLIPTNVFLFLVVLNTLNYFIYHSRFICVPIIQELAKSFSFWYTVWNIVSFHVCVIFLWSPTTDVICAIIHSAYSILLMTIYEAHAGKHLKVMKIVTVIGFISYIPIFVVLLFNLVEFRKEKFYHKPSGLEIIDVRLQALDNMATIIIYLLRILFMHVIQGKSNCLTFLSNFYEIEHENKAASPKGEPPSSHDSQKKGNQGCNIAPNNIPMVSVVPNLSESNEIGLGVGNNSNKINNEDKSNNRPDVQIKLKGNDITSKSKEKPLVVGILEEKVLEYDPNLTLHHIFVKDRLPAFSKILRSKYYTMIGMGFSLASLLLSFLVAVDLDFGEPFLYFGTAVVFIGILFITIQIVMTCNFFMASYLLHSFDYCFVMFLIFKVLVTSGILCNWDVRVVSWFFAVFAFNWSIMVDAFHVKTRKASYLVVCGTVWMLGAAILCKLNIGKTFENDRFIRLEGLNPISSRITLSTSAFSIALFTFRFFWSYSKNPNRILFITENVQVKDIIN